MCRGVCRCAAVGWVFFAVGLCFFVGFDRSSVGRGFSGVVVGLELVVV